MQFNASITIMPHKELLDPQGKAVAKSMHNLHLDSLNNVRIGKHITLTVEATDEKEAEKMVSEACSRLLANPIMENFEFELTSS